MLEITVDLTDVDVDVRGVVRGAGRGKYVVEDMEVLWRGAVDLTDHLSLTEYRLCERALIEEQLGQDDSDRCDEAWEMYRDAAHRSAARG